MLVGLPCAGQAMGPINIPMTWHADFLARFVNVPQNDHASAPYMPYRHPRAHLDLNPAVQRT
jgi:hypothetical protein